MAAVPILSKKYIVTICKTRPRYEVICTVICDNKKLAKEVLDDELLKEYIKTGTEGLVGTIQECKLAETTYYY